jgi:hypothetical protein
VTILTSTSLEQFVEEELMILKTEKQNEDGQLK